MQIMKVRSYVRLRKYLLNPLETNEHKSMDGKNTLSEDLIKLPSIAISNAKEYINAKINGASIKLTPVFVTQEDEEEYCSLQNKTKDEIKTLIYRVIETFDKDTSKFQYEIFDKTVKRKKKEDYIEFFLSLAEQIENVHDNFDDDDNE